MAPRELAMLHLAAMLGQSQPAGEAASGLPSEACAAGAPGVAGGAAGAGSRKHGREVAAAGSSDMAEAPAKRRGVDAAAGVARSSQVGSRPHQAPGSSGAAPQAPPAAGASLHELLLAALLTGAGAGARGAGPPAPPPLPSEPRRHAAPSESDEAAAAGSEDRGRAMTAAPKRRLTDHQESLLHASFAACPTLTRERKASLAAAAQLAPRQVEVWFQNRRARLKMRDAASRCTALEAENERLRAENAAVRAAALSVSAALEALQKSAAGALISAHAQARAAAAAAVTPAVPHQLQVQQPPLLPMMPPAAMAALLSGAAPPLASALPLPLPLPSSA